MPNISIVIPVYKAEKFLHRCIESLLRQTYTNFEIILVDDGSPDSSGKICDEYSYKYSFIKSFHTNNNGVSAARNYGITRAQGEWICFIDSDDFVEDNYLEHFFINGELQSQFLYVQKGFKIYDAHIKQTYSCGIAENAPTNTTESFITGELNHILNSPCMKLYNRNQIIKSQIEFDCTLSLGEDHMFVLDYLLSDNVLCVKIIDGNGYNYVKNENENSLTLRPIPYLNLLKYAINSYEKRLKLIARYGINDEGFLNFIKVETKTYRIRAMLSYFSQYKYCKGSLKGYRKLYEYLTPFRGLSTSKYCGLRPTIGYLADILPYWINYLTFPTIIALYKLTKKIFKKIR